MVAAAYICQRVAFCPERKKSAAAAKLRTWAVTMVRSKGEYLGEAPDREKWQTWGFLGDAVDYRFSGNIGGLSGPRRPQSRNREHVVSRQYGWRRQR